MSTLGRRTQSIGEEQESGRKPKKVNSEIRKQQNRIASRNYREKRKRKLQYLQQLVKDGDPSEHEGSHTGDQCHGRLMTPEYGSPTRQTFLPHDSYTALSPGGSNVPHPMLSSASPYDTSFRPSPQPLQSFQPAWPVSMYEPLHPVNISAWSVPHWIPGMEYTPPMTSRSDTFQFTPPQSHHSYEELSTPPQQTRTPEPDMYLMDHSRRQDTYFAPASLPSSAATSPYCHPRYAGP